MVATSASLDTLVINAAFLQEIKDSNPALWSVQHQLRQVCESEQEPAAIVRDLVRLLDDFRDRLSLQFALEEAYGYQKVTGSVVSPLIDAELISRTHGQHCSLYLEISDLAEQAEELQYRGVQPQQLSELVTATKAFDGRLRQHEQFESDLIDQLFE